MLGNEVRPIAAHKLKVGDVVWSTDTRQGNHHINAKVLSIAPNKGKTAFDEWLPDTYRRVVCEGGVRFDADATDRLEVWLPNTERR
jgi:hypothetical protein